MQPYRAISCALALAIITGAVLPSSGAQQTSVGSGSTIADARRHLASAQLPEAERDLREMLVRNPSSAEAHFLLGYVLFRERRPAESLAEYNAAAQLRTPVAEELIAIASNYILLKDLADAEKWLLFATSHDPANATAWYLLGRTQYNQDHNADAVHSFTRSLELRPKDVRSEYNLGLAYEKLQRRADAIAAYNTAITWQSGLTAPDPQPWLDLGTLLLREAEPAQALGPLQEAVRFGPHNALAHQQLGLALEALGRYDQAIASLQRASALAPGAEQPHFFLGRIFRHLGRTSDAAAEYDDVSKLLGSHSDTATPNMDVHPEPSPNQPLHR